MKHRIDLVSRAAALGLLATMAACAGGSSYRTSGGASAPQYDPELFYPIEGRYRGPTTTTVVTAESAESAESDGVEQRAESPAQAAPAEAPAPQSAPDSEEATGGEGGGGSDAPPRELERSDDRFAAIRREPGPVRSHTWEVAPIGPARALLATVDVPPHHAFRPPATACQDVIVLVRGGELEATGTGIAPLEAPATLYVGDAVLFGSEADGAASNLSDRPVRTLVVVARRSGRGSATMHPDRAESCDAPPVAEDLTRPQRVASTATTPALSAASGRLEVRILFDESGGAEQGALSLLSGAPDLVVPEHAHADSAEILMIDEGEGTMRLGDREIPVRSGSAIYVPEGVTHSFRGAGTRPLRAVQIYAPGGPEQRFRTPG